MTTITLPVVPRRDYIGRHHTGPADLRDAGGRRQVPCPVPADYSPLRPADRIRLAPTYWADRHLPAGPDERTGRVDPAAVLALSTQAPAASAPADPNPDYPRGRIVEPWPCDADGCTREQFERDMDAEVEAYEADRWGEYVLLMGGA